jgi:hypothetical protein
LRARCSSSDRGLDERGESPGRDDPLGISKPDRNGCEEDDGGDRGRQPGGRDRDSRRAGKIERDERERPPD